MQRLKLFALLSAVAMASLFAVSANTRRREISVQKQAFDVRCSIIDEFDECIQLRFLRDDSLFGPARVITFPTNMHHFGNFNPDNDHERNAVANLEKDGWQVFLYLAGRQIMYLEDASPNSKREDWAGLSFPAIITSMKKENGRPYGSAAFAMGGRPEKTTNGLMIPLPKDRELRTHVKKAFEVFTKQEQYDFSVQGLSFTARPVRAEASCLGCHNNPDRRGLLTVESVGAKPVAPSLKVGDAIGAAIYAYTNIKQK